MTPHMPYFMSRLPHHPSLQRYTWRIGVVLTGLFMSELNETFSIGSKYIFKLIGVNFTGLRNQPVLQDSRMTLGGKMESWQGYLCQNWMKLSVEVLNTFFNYLLSTLMVTGTNLSSKTPGSDLEDRWSLDRVIHVRIDWNFQCRFEIHF